MVFINRSLLFSLALLLGFQASAFGHGYQLSLTGNKLTALPEDEVNFSNHVFFAPFDQFNTHTYFTDHGSVEAVSGIDLSHDTLQIQFLSPLWYSSGGVAQRASSDLTLEATSYDSFGGQLGNPIDITGTSVNLGSFPVVGNDAHSIGWELFNSASTPAVASGAYGVAYEVKGYKNGDMSTPFQTSEPLVVVFNTPTFTGSNLSSAQFAVYRAIMRGDFNLDGGRSTADLSVMLGAFSNLSSYQSSHGLLPGDIQAIADVNQDGAISNADIQSLLNVLKNGDGAAAGVPEPSSWLLICSGLLIFRARQWRK